MSPQPVQAAVAASYREEWGRIVATLIRRTGDWDLAEECAQDAFAEALRRWPADGIPRRPGAWLTTVAGNRALDRLRRNKRGAELLEQVGADPTASRHTTVDSHDEDDDCVNDETDIPDDRLRLMFTCCHPALALEGRVALTLRALAGLTTAEIARAFLVPEATMAKRLTRAKAKIAAAGIPFRVPPASLLPERTAGVLAVIYLLFNEGYAASAGERLIREPLCAEAIRLARLLSELMPGESEAKGLLGLMVYAHSRRDARLSATGELVTLEEQDRSRWHGEEIAEADELLTPAPLPGELGFYGLQAAIAACHAHAPSARETDWTQIRGLYELLVERQPSPVVRLNHAIAIAMAGELEPALALLDELAGEGTLADYHLLEAARADLQRRGGDAAGAAASYRRALELARVEPERRFLLRRLAELESSI